MSRGGGHLQALDGAQDRDGRRDHAIAIEQRGAGQADHEEGGTPPFVVLAVCRQAEEGHDPALALIIGPHNEQHVFRRDHDHQRPEHQRQQAKHNLGSIAASGRLEALAQRVDRARANVAVHHTERAHDKGAAHRVSGC